MMPAGQTPRCCLLSLAGLLAAICFPALAKKHRMCPDRAIQPSTSAPKSAKVATRINTKALPSLRTSRH